jgi:hypothetical protein
LKRRRLAAARHDRVVIANGKVEAANLNVTRRDRLDELSGPEPLRKSADDIEEGASATSETAEDAALDWSFTSWR